MATRFAKVPVEISTVLSEIKKWEIPLCFLQMKAGKTNPGPIQDLDTQIPFLYIQPTSNPILIIFLKNPKRDLNL